MDRLEVLVEGVRGRLFSRQRLVALRMNLVLRSIQTPQRVKYAL
jgi:hypothetical protein